MKKTLEEILVIYQQKKEKKEVNFPKIFDS